VLNRREADAQAAERCPRDGDVPKSKEVTSTLIVLCWLVMAWWPCRSSLGRWGGDATQLEAVSGRAESLRRHISMEASGPSLGSCCRCCWPPRQSAC